MGIIFENHVRDSCWLNLSSIHIALSSIASRAHTSSIAAMPMQSQPLDLGKTYAINFAPFGLETVSVMLFAGEFNEADLRRYVAGPPNRQRVINAQISVCAIDKPFLLQFLGHGRRTCIGCNKVADQMSACTCWAHYCSPQCQNSDWGQHRPEHRRLLANCGGAFTDAHKQPLRALWKEHRDMQSVGWEIISQYRYNVLQHLSNHNARHPLAPRAVYLGPGHRISARTMANWFFTAPTMTGG